MNLNFFVYESSNQVIQILNYANYRQKKKLVLPPAPSPVPAPTTPQAEAKTPPAGGIEPLDLSIRGSSMPANPISPSHCGSGGQPLTPPLANSTPADIVSTPNCGPGSPVSSPFEMGTPSWADDSLAIGLANWIHSVENTDKPPTNVDSDSDCVMIEEPST